MRNQSLILMDLSKRADNGLVRGFTTGVCATAAVQAAILKLERGVVEEQVHVTLPDNEHYLVVPIASMSCNDDGSVTAAVVKFAGDDPDCTDGATITATVQRNDQKTIRFFAGKGVGIVTEPGIKVPVGEPAINPGPREMMRVAINEALECDREDTPVNGYDLIIGCKDGESIAKRTFNPRLGITGGISILGTTGVVEPMSLAAYTASIEVYIRVALSGETTTAAFLPGNIGLAFAQDKLGLTRKRIVHISNFIGFALESAQTWLSESRVRLGQLWLLGHPGKLAKVLDGIWDTHSKKSDTAVKTIAAVADSLTMNKATVETIKRCSSVEMLLECLKDDRHMPALWSEVEKRLSLEMQKKVPNVERLAAKLFDMKGQQLVE